MMQNSIANARRRLADFDNLTAAQRKIVRETKSESPSQLIRDFKIQNSESDYQRAYRAHMARFGYR